MGFVLSGLSPAERAMAEQSIRRHRSHDELLDMYKALTARVDLVEKRAGLYGKSKPAQTPEADLDSISGTGQVKYAFYVDNTLLKAETNGLGFRSSPCMEDKVADGQALALWGTCVSGCDLGNGWIQVGEYFLPKRINGITVLTKDIYIADRRGLAAKTHGLAYRRSKREDDKLDEILQWGSFTTGIDEGDGWLRVGDKFLPFRLDGQAVLLKHSREMRPREATSCSGCFSGLPKVSPVSSPSQTSRQAREASQQKVQSTVEKVVCKPEVQAPWNSTAAVNGGLDSAAPTSTTVPSRDAVSSLTQALGSANNWPERAAQEVQQLDVGLPMSTGILNANSPVTLEAKPPLGSTNNSLFRLTPEVKSLGVGLSNTSSPDRAALEANPLSGTKTSLLRPTLEVQQADVRLSNTNYAGESALVVEQLESIANSGAMPSPVEGQEVVLTSDVERMQAEFAALGKRCLRSQASKAGQAGRVTKVNLPDGTAQIDRGIGWTPIRALVGFETWTGEALQRQKASGLPGRSQPTSPESASSPTFDSVLRQKPSVITSPSSGSQQKPSSPSQDSDYLSRSPLARRLGAGQSLLQSEVIGSTFDQATGSHRPSPQTGEEPLPSSNKFVVSGGQRDGWSSLGAPVISPSRLIVPEANGDVLSPSGAFRGR